MTTMTIDPRQHALMGLCIETVRRQGLGSAAAWPLAAWEQLAPADSV
jgi:hypothetical protein